ncbi:biliverdin-producing heme oxygenase [Thalassospira sp. TSL5-1]|uniref:biliverdin-producing heme oxygenase n=1 Tax=Thalassospira sp. TSL5-1 TaxID=1544451 RepID=UPI00093BEB76|nr:biliverdin-producing heme oxygenase [Thalassospira sp. TSL5-1]OKH87281.1 heme oxygenase [Thalassospira sp. TSL5-1]
MNANQSAQGASAQAMTRIERVKAATRDDHQQIDDMVMAMKPFDSRVNYARFLKMQYCFHRVMKPLYEASDLNDLIPGLASRSRFDDVCADLADLKTALPGDDMMPESARGSSDMAAPQKGVGRLGWLYVCEGSSLGAAFLLKAAGNIGLDEAFGARHLRGHADGRGKHWREFVAQLNGLELDEAGEAEVMQGAHDAFTFFHSLLLEDQRLAA